MAEPSLFADRSGSAMRVFAGISDFRMAAEVFLNSLLMGPGSIRLKPIPVPRSSTRWASASDSTACFDAQ